MNFSSTFLLSKSIANCNKSRLLFLQSAKRFSTHSAIAKHKNGSAKPINVDILGTWDSRTELPLELESSINYGKPIPQILTSSVGTHSIQGRRSYNEDRFVVKELRPNLLYFSVFDGHGGSECADYCYRHMEDHLTFWLDRLSVSDIEHAIDAAFLEVNNSFARWWAYHGKATSNVPGTTATISLLHKNMDLYIGHVVGLAISLVYDCMFFLPYVLQSCFFLKGDSRAMLCRGGVARRLTTDHCPSLLAEKTRIEQSQGKIIVDDVGRAMVNGRLAMTRSIGDLELKPFGVTAVPDVRKVKIKHGRDAFLVLTTDGINCVMSDQEICDVVQRTEDPAEAAHCLTDAALHYSSEDNATAIVVPLGSWGNNTTSASIFYSFGRSMTDSSRFS
uniref:Phosphatase 1K, mitochondrial n=1 Tax=Daphnia magna TaxID=35525 RepID=A0A0P6D586_9CRUS